MRGNSINFIYLGFNFLMKSYWDQFDENRIKVNNTLDHGEQGTSRCISFTKQIK